MQRYNIWHQVKRGVLMHFLNKKEKEALYEFTSRIKSVLDTNLFDLKLFGSKTTGKFHEESDIDVLIVVNHRDDKVLDIVSEILLDIDLKYAANISPIVLTAAEFAKNQQAQTMFYNEIARDGITL